MLRSPCEEWQGSKDRDGYGRIWTGGKIFRAHRLAYMQHHGHTDLLVRHDCDNPSCINMDHLRSGTYQENTQDRDQRGRNHNANKVNCPQGHPYDDKNTYVNGGDRYCLTCKRGS